MLKQGPPPKNARTSKTAQYVVIFIVAGLILYGIVVGLSSILDEVHRALFSVARNIFPQTLVSAVFAGLVGAIQAWILREHLETQNLFKFVSFAVLGGATGGFVAGLIMNITGASLNFFQGLWIGGLAGAIAGVISSAGQNTFMSSAGRQGQWLIYSIISWALIWGFGWGLSWQIGYLVGTSIGSIFMMATTGIALSIFLSKTALEF